MIRGLKTALLGTFLLCAGLGGAQAQVIYNNRAVPAYGYAGSAIRGDYVGAPFTRFPRPDQIVPSAWGYGTYGVPTVSGIPPAPVGTPTIYVIDAPAAPAGAKAARSRVVSRSRAGTFTEAQAVVPGGPRIISVSVPPRPASAR